MKTLASASVYYNDIYLIIPAIRNNIGLWQAQYSSELYSKDISAKELGTLILDAINFSETNECQYDLRDFWTVVNIKSFTSFSKKFSKINVIKCENKLEVSRWYVKTRGYESSENPNDTIELSLDATPENIGNTVKNLLKNNLFQTSTDIGRIETVNNTIFTYQIPDAEKFEDIGDNHSDAYQFYVSNSNKNNYIGFLIDNGYESFEKSDIKTKWELYYGSLEEFNYVPSTSSPAIIKIFAKTTSKEIHSYLIPDKENFLEILFEIDLTDTPENQSNARLDFQKIILSLKESS